MNFVEIATILQEYSEIILENILIYKNNFFIITVIVAFLVIIWRLFKLYSFFPAIFFCTVLLFFSIGIEFLFKEFSYNQEYLQSAFYASRTIHNIATFFSLPSAFLFLYYNNNSINTMKIFKCIVIFIFSVIFLLLSSDLFRIFIFLSAELIIEVAPIAKTALLLFIFYLNFIFSLFILIGPTLITARALR